MNNGNNASGHKSTGYYSTACSTNVEPVRTGKPIWLIFLGIATFIAGGVSLLISQFWLIVHFLWSESVSVDLLFWGVGILLVLTGYFLLVWHKSRKHFPRIAETCYKVSATLIVLTILGIGIVTPSFFVLSEKQGDVLPDIVPEQHVPVEYAVSRCEERGSMTALTYETPAFDVNGQASDTSVQKQLRIYLPAAYDPNQRYDVLYMLNFDENLYFDGGRENGIFRNFFDHMIADGRIPPLIVVACATGYHTSDVLNEETQAAFQAELRQIILPLVESTYSTYAEATDAAAFEASRDHRMVCGFSNGGYSAMYTFLYSLDYFRCFFVTGGSLFDNPTVPARLQAAVDRWQGRYSAEDFVLAFGTGGRDMSYPGLVEQYQGICNLHSSDFIPDSTLPHGNLFLQIGENYRHGAEAMMSYLYVYLPMLLGERTL